MHTSGASHGGGHQQNKKQGGIDIWEVREFFFVPVFLKFEKKVSMALDRKTLTRAIKFQREV